jgi:hypothetical protein
VVVEIIIITIIIIIIIIIIISFSLCAHERFASLC